MRASRSFPNDAQVVGRARSFVTDLLAGSPRPFIVDVQLMTSELVTNAIRHADSECTVTVETRDDLITVSVTDTGEGFPAATDPGHHATSGRGLMIVSALARDWGVHLGDTAPGKTVWFTVQLPDEARSRPALEWRTGHGGAGSPGPVGQRRGTQETIPTPRPGRPLLRVGDPAALALHRSHRSGSGALTSRPAPVARLARGG